MSSPVDANDGSTQWLRDHLKDIEAKISAYLISLFLVGSCRDSRVRKVSVRDGPNHEAFAESQELAECSAWPKISFLGIGERFS